MSGARPKNTNIKRGQLFAKSNSCATMKNDQSMIELEEMRVLQENSEVLSDQSTKQHHTDLDFIFMLLEENIVLFVKNELKRVQKILSSDYPTEEVNSEGEEQRNSREAFLKITENFLRRMKQKELADCLQSKSHAAVCSHQFNSSLKKKFQCVFGGISEAGNPTPLNQIYTDLYITEGWAREVNDEHEVRQIERVWRKPDRAETTIRHEDIFKASPGRDQPIRTVMTKGVAGIGKTVLTQKFTLDWAEDKTNQDIHFTFPFTFRELNMLKKKKLSLVELVHLFFAETKEAGICRFDQFQVAFIFDGLDECRLPLDFHNTEILTDVTKSASVNVLLTNLIRGKLLPSARLWITTRPAAANQIPRQYVDMMTEVRGFTGAQKEEYFWKRFTDEKQATEIITHIMTSQSLHIMCHIPVFCWITATVLEEVLKTREGGELPKTLTEMYIHFLVVQSKVKYDGGTETDPHWSPDTKKMIESLGKLAFVQLQKGNLIFYESDLTECGINIRAASVYSGVLTQIFKEERGLYKDKVFCFVHLSVQEFLAALHVHLTFIKSGVNLLPGKQTVSCVSFRKTVKQTNPTLFYQSAVDEAVQSPNGHLDLFLRFLLGLSLESNQTLLRCLMSQTEISSQTYQETVQYIDNTSVKLSPEKSINLFHCLNELNNHPLEKEIRQDLRPGRLSPYACELELDMNTANGHLKWSDRTVTSVTEDQLYRDHPDRFDFWPQLLCSNGLSGRCYWEVEWKGVVHISVSHRGIRRKGDSNDCFFGRNDLSWSLLCSDDGHYSVWHNDKETSISSSCVFNRAAVYVDYPARTLSFYRVSSDSLIHLHTFTFNPTFTEPPYPGFWIGDGSSVSLCPL